MDEKRNNRSVERRLKECLKQDRARIQVGRISHFGLMEMSRQRIRTSVLESSTDRCPHCGGTGHVRSVSSVALQCLRMIEESLQRGATHNLTVRTRSEIALYVLNHKRTHLYELEKRFQITITVSADPGISGQQPFVIEKGEQMHSLEQARAIAAQSTSVAAIEPPEEDLFEEPIEEEAEVEKVEAEADEEADTFEEESGEAGEHAESAEAGERGENGDGGRRRRRRRRRGRPRQEGAVSDIVPGVTAVETVAEPAAEDETVEADEEEIIAAEGAPNAVPGQGNGQGCSSTTAGELEAAVARYLGAARARRAFSAYMRESGGDYDPSQEASAQLIRHAEFLLSPAIGASTSRQVLSLLLRPRAVSGESALKLIDEASAAIQSSRDQLQHALDHARQGITVFDANLSLTAWNREFADLFDLPPAMLHLGVGLDEIVRFNAARGAYGPGDSEDFVAERVAALLFDDQPTRLRLFSARRVIEVRSARLPDGGIVTTYTDVTQTVQTEEALEAANELLEMRVDERTAELQRLNAELARAKTVAEAANLSKTRFLAAASHDILQPLNAARLYASSLSEGASQIGREERADLARNVDVSLEAVEEILGALLDISRLDAGAMKAEISDVPVADLMRMLDVEFAPIAKARGLDLRFVATKPAIRTDRRLMRRLLQNLVSNALKYTLKGRVLVGCRRAAGGALRIEVWDTGLGIPADRQRAVFEVFQRLDQGARVARGLGLGLSIVERLGRVLGQPVGLNSRPGKGSVFFVTAPIGTPAPESRGERGAPLPAPRSEPLRGLKVLAIDNEPRVLEGMKSLMSRWGCAVVTAHGLEEARDALATFGAPDVVIADYHLDHGDGVEAIRVLRKALGRHVSAILATADRSPEVRDEAARADIIILNKPLKPAPLRAQLTRYSALREAAE